MPPTSAAPTWLIEPLGKRHDRAAFARGDPILDHYLKEMAGQDAPRLVAAPFVTVAANAPRIIPGYYTLSAFGVDPGSLPASVGRRLPAYPLMPATLLGRLAVYQRYQEQGIGGFLLMDALHRASLCPVLVP
jgi:GNAT superfamily N-acetyltransferase